MAASNTAVYAVVDKSEKRKKHSLPQNEIAESTLPNSFDSPVYDMTEHSVDTPPVHRRDEAFNSEYSMITLDNMYSTVSENTPQRGAEQASGSTTQGQNPEITTKVPQKKRLEGEGTGCKLFTCVFITIAVVATITLICLAILFAEVLKLKAQTTSTQQPFINQQAENATTDFSSIMFQLQTLGNDIQQLNSTLGQQLNNSIRMVMLDQEMSNNTIWELLARVNSIQDTNQRIIDQIGRSQATPAPSCATLIALSPSFSSDYYWIRASNGFAVRVYCDMTRSCGGVTGGWMRVAELNMTKSGQQCPSGLQRNNGYCRRESFGAGCSEVVFTTSGFSYSKICGRIIARQEGTTDGFSQHSRTPNIDGVQLATQGTMNYHIWTFAAAQGEDDCRCSKTTGSQSPTGVGNDYFCDVGMGLIWNGNCTTLNTCCSFNDPPWFYRELVPQTTDDIEMSVCRNENRNNEDIQIQTVQIYVQ